MAENEKTTTSTGTGEPLTPEVQKPETVQPSTEDLLKQIAKERGLQPTDLEILPKKELQALIDSKIRQALQTREENLKKKAQEETLKAEQRYEELFSIKQQELDEERKRLDEERIGFEQERTSIRIKSRLTSLNLDAEWSEYIAVSEANEVDKAVELFAKKLNAYVDKRIKDIQEKGVAAVGKKNAQGVDYGALVQPFIRQQNQDPFAKLKGKQ